MSTGTKTDETGAASAPAKDAGKEMLAKYVGDMAALESHIEESLDRQLGLTKKHELSGPLVREFHDMVRDQRNQMIEMRDALGSTPGNPIKEVGSNLLGKAAGVIDKVRSGAVSKALRDDYTAFNLAAISYTMLYTTAKSVGSDDVAKLAEKGLTNYASAVQKINQVIPEIVLSELADEEGMKVMPGIGDQVRGMVNKAWKSTDQSGSGSQPA